MARSVCSTSSCRSCSAVGLPSAMLAAVSSVARGAQTCPHRTPPCSLKVAPTAVASAPLYVRADGGCFGACNHFG
eukprot:2199181-Pyramimonas_sp.AAC.1